MDTPPPFRILMVCTGNICRSPMAERLLQHGLDASSPGIFKVTSAGTRALVGNGIEPHVAEFIRAAGAASENFSARQLTPTILKDQDLVLGMTREHRGRIVELQPTMLKKTFTLRELSNLISTLNVYENQGPAEIWEALIPMAIRARGLQRNNIQNDDIIDPYGSPMRIYEQMRTEIASAVNLILNHTGKFKQSTNSFLAANYGE